MALFRRPKPRTFLARQAVRVAEHWTGNTMLPINYPPQQRGPRYGHGRPPHAGLLALLGEGHDLYAQNLQAIAGHGGDLADLPLGPQPNGLAWLNAWFPPLDMAALYGFVRDRRPRRYLEVGSGISTLCARRAISDGGLPTQVISIDPEPRAEVDAVCDQVVRRPLESVAHDVFDQLEAGDIVFMDGSHRVLANSDTVAFFLDVLPELPDGVLVGVHDILLPDDYLPEWADFHWSEQYLVAAYLLARGDQVRVELPCWYVHAHTDLSAILDPVWSTPDLEALTHAGVTLWMTTTGREVS